MLDSFGHFVSLWVSPMFGAAYVRSLHMNGSHYGQNGQNVIFFPLVLCWDRVHYGGYSISVLVSSHGRYYVLFLNSIKVRLVKLRCR